MTGLGSCLRQVREAQISRDRAQLGVIAVDTPFAGTGNAYLDRRAASTGRATILLTLYGTAHIHNHPEPDPARLAWERASLAAAASPGVYAADIGAFLTGHLAAAYGVRKDKFIPWRSSLDLTAPDLQPMAPGQAAAVAAAFGIPPGRPVIATIGRTDPAKGIDLLIDALRPLRDPLIDLYRRQITAGRLSATLVPQFTRDLPRALAALPATRAVAARPVGSRWPTCPSRWRSGPAVAGPERRGPRPRRIPRADHQRTDRPSLRPSPPGSADRSPRRSAGSRPGSAYPYRRCRLPARHRHQGRGTESRRNAAARPPPREPPPHGNLGSARTDPRPRGYTAAPVTGDP